MIQVWLVPFTNHLWFSGTGAGVVVGLCAVLVVVAWVVVVVVVVVAEVVLLVDVVLGALLIEVVLVSIFLGDTGGLSAVDAKKYL